MLVAAARYLAAHAPTMRAQGQTYQMAHRLARGSGYLSDDRILFAPHAVWDYNSL